MDLTLAVEAILFSSPDPLSVREIAKLAGASVEEVEKAVRDLMREYSERKTSLEVIEIGGKFLMRVRPEYAHLVEKISEREFDRGTLRTLAVIAVRQPITLSRLAKIRGNKCYEHVKKLKDMGFVKAEKRGRSTVLTTTKEFASYFGIASDDPKEIKEALRRYISDETGNSELKWR